MGSWVEDLAAPFCRDWDVPLIEVEWLIRKTIEEAARRVRDAELMAAVGPHRATAFHMRERSAKAIEAMLTTDETQRGGGR